ncbi:MAG: Gfo/Idh/MocA family oxidoreductase [Thermoguttaceae bacterium]|nr:Gfo/Idh/MocA family oxidoreductase [Thermoguttaceae bacterium]
MTTRRTFLKSSATAGIAAFAAPAVAMNVRGANERIRVGLVGLGGRMRSHIGSLTVLSQPENVEIAAICDCDQTKRDNAVKAYPDLEGLKLKTYSEQRKLFDDKDIDAVSFSTQDHWHALQTIWACQAGKDVYVEKPPTWCIWEGRQMVRAARKYGRMVQIGTQNRSTPNIREGMQQLKDGLIGDLYMARGMTYKMRGNLGKHSPRPVPAGLDWDAWVGPAKMVEYSNFQHRRWYWNSNFASGDVANQTVHDIDKIRWGLGLEDHPITVMSMGDRFPPGDDDAADTPNTQAFMCKWADRKVLVTFEIRHWYTNSEAEMRDKYPFVAENQCVGEIFFGTKGYMIFPDYSSYYSFLGPKNEPGPFKTAGQVRDAVSSSQLTDWRTESAPHFKNWIDAIRSRKHEDLNADVEQGHLSTTVCHLAKISCQLGRSVHFDPKTERFVNDPEADRYLRRDVYRAPYVIPEEV